MQISNEDQIRKIKDVCSQRLSQPASSPYRMADICSSIPELITNEHGYHTNCYKKFTSHLNRLEQECHDDCDSKDEHAHAQGSN